MWMKCETDQYPYLELLLQVSGAIAPFSPPPIFVEGQFFPSRVVFAAIRHQ